MYTRRATTRATWGIAACRRQVAAAWCCSINLRGGGIRCSDNRVTRQYHTCEQRPSFINLRRKPLLALPSAMPLRLGSDGALANSYWIPGWNFKSDGTTVAINSSKNHLIHLIISLFSSESIFSGFVMFFLQQYSLW